MSDIKIVRDVIGLSSFELRPTLPTNGLNFQIWDTRDPVSGRATISPYETIDFMIAPSGVMSIETASDYLTGDKEASPANGRYFTKQSNPGVVSTGVYININIPEERLWENSPFDLFWYKHRAIDSYSNISGNLDSVYSYPHKITQSDISLASVVTDELGSGQLTLGLTYTALKNDSVSDYGGLSPYGIAIGYDELPPGVSEHWVPGWEPYVGYLQATGIVIDLPYYIYDNVPATYWIWVAYEWAGATKFAAEHYDQSVISSGVFHFNHDYRFRINAAELGTNSRLFSKTPNGVTGKIVKVEGGDQAIERTVIERRRACIGIKDISLGQNSYAKKSGTYVSQAYPLDFVAYTFSLKVDEYIPDYKDINKYSTVKYYVQFNNQEWQRVSPMNRPDEYDGQTLVTKMFIFDKGNALDNLHGNVQFILGDTPVNVFAVKIVFDFSSVVDEAFIPAEIKNYKAVIFDRTQLLSESLK